MEPEEKKCRQDFEQNTEVITPSNGYTVDTIGDVMCESAEKHGIQKKGIYILLAVIACIMVVFGVLCGTHVICLKHDWRAATCTESETCSKCHRFQGEPLGHEWLKATCAEPETCSVCGETHGVALGHKWTEATCTEPEICSVCGETRGVALGHKWIEATCTEPEICSVCGETQGDALGHTEGSWLTTIEPSLNKTGKYSQYCTTCGELMDTRMVTKKPQVNTTSFNFESEEFLTYLGAHTNSDYTVSTVGAEVDGAENFTAYPVYENGSLFALLLLKTDSSGYVTAIAPAAEDENSSVALAMHIVSKIDTDCDTDVALVALALVKSYTTGGMDIVTGNLDEYTMTVITPEDLVG